MIDQIKVIMQQFASSLNVAGTNLHIDRILTLPITDDTGFQKELVNWSISCLNITDVSFEGDTSNFLLLEPNQRIKLYFSKVKFALKFLSFFMINHDLLDYDELSNVTITINELSSVTIFVSLNVDPITNALRMKLEQVLISGDGSNIKFEIVSGQGMFIR